MREGSKVRADNYRGAGELHLDMGTPGITIGGREGITGVMVKIATEAHQRKQAWLGKRFVCLGN